ncbi:iron-siderophore ABC transporter substrate-binding protein [Nostoc sp. CCCryo 231-06]|nr:iron-siderophore ABC transporter substrate-binding protein [Nostoc sp. CCCryo 231-06]
MGETCVPNHPKRVITTSPVILGHTLALGVKPIASSAFLDGELTTSYLSYQTYLGNKAERIKQIGTRSEPNLERILLLKPDLILSLEETKTFYPLLSQIAPTVMFPLKDIRINWKERFNSIAKVLGKQAEAQQAWNHYYQRVEELKIALSNRYQDKTISVVGAYGNSIFSYAKDSFSASILNDLGLQRPPTQNFVIPDGIINNISEEKLEKIDGDILFVLNFDRRRKDIEELQQKPIWKTLRSVQQRQVHLVDGWAWDGLNLLAADAVIDDLYKSLVNTP